MANKRFIDFPIATTVGDNDIILIWQGGANKQTTKATILSGVPDSLNDLTDVTISGLTNGQILRYDSVTGQWENTDQGNLDLNDLNDVTIVSPTNGQVLVYNSSTSKWENSSGGYVPYVGAVTTVNLGAQSIQAGSFVKQGGTSSQFLKADGSVDSTAYGTGSVTSVGLTMPAAFNVANSPITTSGTLAVTGAGTVAQYIRGDGSLADFPESSGGGSSVSYYLNGSVDQGTIGGIAYKELSKVPILGAGTDFTINADGYIASFITDAGDPNLLEIPGGNWNFETYFSASSGGGSPTFYVELYKVSGTTATLIASSSSAPELIAFGTNLTPYFSSLAVPTTTLALTDRLAVRYYVTHSGRTITLHTENNHLCQIITTFTTGLTALNGLTAQVQNFAVGTTGTDFNIASATATHTFNLPTASATNRGALSSTDWSLFTQAYNDKINSAAVTGTTTKTLTLTQQDGGTITASWSDLNTDAVLSVFGRTGAVVAANGDYTTAQVTESGNLYYTDARSRAALSFAAGSGAYNTSTGVITIPTNNNQITNGAGYITSAALAGYLPLTGGTLTGPLGGTTISLSGDITANRYRGVNSLVLNSYTTVNPSSNVYLYSPPNDRDAWIYLDSADTGSNWGIYHRQIDSAVSGLPANSIGFVGGGSSTLQAWISLANGNGYYAGSLTASSIIRSGGTSSQYLMADGSVSTLSNPVTGTGTSGQVAYFNGTTSITSESNLFWDATNDRLGINNATPGKSLDIVTNVSQDGIRITGSSNPRLTIIDSTNNVQFDVLTTDTEAVIRTDTNHPLHFTTNGVPRMYLNTSGNLGLGVTPSAWFSTVRAIDISTATALWAGGNGQPALGYNVFVNTSGNLIYKTSEFASRYEQISGQHQWFNAPSGTAGNAISFTQAMTLFSTGNLLVGSPSPISDNGARLQVSGDVRTTGTLRVEGNTDPNSGAAAFFWNQPFLGPTISGYNFEVRTGNTGSQARRFFINESGAATFSSSVTAGDGLIINDGNGIPIRIQDISAAITGQTAGYIGMSTSAFSGNNGDLVLYPRTSVASRILLMGGNVGIGTASPSGKLHLSSTSDTYLVMTGGATPRTYSLLVDATNLRLFSGVGDTTLLTIASTGAATFSSSVNVGGVSSNTDFRIYRTVAPSVFFSISAPGGTPNTSTLGVNGTDVMVLNASGNVGIGTNSPTSRLTIAPPQVTNASSLEFSGTDNAAISAYYSLTIAVNNSNTQSGRVINFSKGGKGYGDQASTMMSIIADTGNVLIGAVSDVNAKLFVNGDIRTGALDGGYVAGYWKLGRAVIGTQPSETYQIIVEINGQLYSIGAANI